MLLVNCCSLSVVSCLWLLLFVDGLVLVVGCRCLLFVGWRVCYLMCCFCGLFVVWCGLFFVVVCLFVV